MASVQTQLARAAAGPHECALTGASADFEHFKDIAQIRPHLVCSIRGMGVRSRSLRLFQAVHQDARHWQILALSGLFTLSLTSSDFGARPFALLAACVGALFAQTAGTIWTNARRARRQVPSGSHWRRSSQAAGLVGWFADFQWKSALVTSLSLAILLRANSLWFWLAAGFLAITAKFLIRYRGKHIFNPACIGIVAVTLVAGNAAWVSPGQWGQTLIFAAFAIGFAALVLSSAKRIDLALAFLIGFAAMLIGRALYLGDPMTIPLHQLQSGALLVFAFFMITDPRSTPDSRPARLIFAMAVAALAAWMSWELHIRGAMLYALAALALLTPILDRLLPARRFQWTPTEKQPDDPQAASGGVRPRPRLVRA
ncbi:MAG: RnfABCDGE type electron transport complex subunit D [Pseudomonadota bacterium]